MSWSKLFNASTKLPSGFVEGLLISVEKNVQQVTLKLQSYGSCNFLNKSLQEL